MRFRGLTGVIFFWLCFGCTRISEKNLFKFPVETIPDIGYTDTLSPVSVLANADLIEFNVVEKSIISYMLTGPDYLSVTPVDGEKATFGLCRKGRGPGEFISMAPSFDYDDGHLNLMDAHLGKYYSLNLKESLDSAKTIIDKSCTLPWTYDRFNPILAAFSIGKDSLLVYQTVVENSFGRGDSNRPIYVLLKLSTSEVVKQYDCFGRVPSHSRTEMLLDTQQLLHVWHCMNTERNRLCFAMLRTPQINIMDIHTGFTRGFRLDGRPRLNRNRMYLYFLSVCSHENFIYALYSGDEGMNPSSTPLSPATLYVFDWEGRIHEKYLLDAPYQRCVVTADGIYLSKWEDNSGMGLYFVPWNFVR